MRNSKFLQIKLPLHVPPVQLLYKEKLEKKNQQINHTYHTIQLIFFIFLRKLDIGRYFTLIVDTILFFRTKYLTGIRFLSTCLLPHFRLFLPSNIFALTLNFHNRINLNHSSHNDDALSRMQQNNKIVKHALAFFSFEYEERHW